MDDMNLYVPIETYSILQIKVQRLVKGHTSSVIQVADYILFEFAFLGAISQRSLMDK